MTALDIPRPRPVTLHWEKGDVVVVGGLRWIIRLIARTTGEVVLVAANSPSGAITWLTALTTLPKKETR
jgi:hypothetical protein